MKKAIMGLVVPVAMSLGGCQEQAKTSKPQEYKSIPFASYDALKAATAEGKPGTHASWDAWKAANKAGKTD